MEQKVNCPSCGSVNNVGQQFCGVCGAKLAGEAPRQGIACPGCGFENPTGQQFCGACGTKLAGEREQEVVSVSQPEVVSEREPEVVSEREPEVVSEREPEVVSERQPEVVSERQQNVVRVVESLASPRQADVKPTWGLAWGLYWRMALLSLLIGGAVYLIVVILMLAFGFTYPIAF